MIVFGLLPCGPLSIIVQVVYLFIYLGAVKVKTSKDARNEQAFRDAAGNSEPASGNNPFGSTSTPKPASSEGNPFGDAPRRPAPPESNPFGDPPPQAGSPQSNPFADGPDEASGEGGSRSDNPFA